MKVRWTRPALQQLAEILRYIRKDDPAAARRVKARITSDVAKLDSMERRYRMGEVEGTREIVFHPYPYIAVYEIAEREVHILHIRHAAQQWPPPYDL